MDPHATIFVTESGGDFIMGQTLNAYSLHQSIIQIVAERGLCGEASYLLFIFYIFLYLITLKKIYFQTLSRNSIINYICVNFISRIRFRYAFSLTQTFCSVIILWKVKKRGRSGTSSEYSSAVANGLQLSMVAFMPIRLAQVIYISPDSDAPARPRISPGSPISFVLS